MSVEFETVPGEASVMTLVCDGCDVRAGHVDAVGDGYARAIAELLYC